MLQVGVQQARQLGQQLGVVGRLRLEFAQQAARADLLVHPALQKRLGRAPQIQVRVELAAQALDVEQVFAAAPAAAG